MHLFRIAIMFAISESNKTTCQTHVLTINLRFPKGNLKRKEYLEEKFISGNNSSSFARTIPSDCDVIDGASLITITSLFLLLFYNLIVDKKWNK